MQLVRVTVLYGVYSQVQIPVFPNVPRCTWQLCYLKSIVLQATSSLSVAKCVNAHAEHQGTPVIEAHKTKKTCGHHGQDMSVWAPQQTSVSTETRVVCFFQGMWHMVSLRGKHHNLGIQNSMSAMSVYVETAPCWQHS